ncbi:phenolic glucoside malonyltransferase 2 [Triticum aestivum]|uniref:Anthocyanin 5-aromatic acyltransferase n=1 Tax=Triticum aestivum TaxID=4565 RepID=A0A346D789_WHEAT|nr:phenolic glucoside malonyltransferase 2-like [Triticum aestivum]AXM42904.1 anthocyanin 5-aromatic acyltransferase [Triticum aestivum]
MSQVRIVDASYVDVPETAVRPPGPIKLTAMEALWIVIPVLQHVLLYEADDDMPPFHAILQSLRSSLAATLRSFAPLAGKLVHLEETGDVGISCSASDGVRFVVAECDADIGRLAGDEEHDLRVLEGLVPEVDMSQLPAPVLAVQATRFEGGVAVGVTVHHGVADGRALWTFVEAWAAACRGETPATTPCFDRSLVKLPGGEELARSVVRKVAPNLPSVAPPSSLVEDRKRFTRRTFTLDAGDIQRLKQRIVHLGESHGAPLPHSPSTFTAVVALAWTCFARCKPFSPEDDAQLFFFADTRARLDPPVDVGYIGACLTGLISKLPVPELRGDRALPAAASAVEDEISKVKKDPIAGWNFLTLLTGACLDRMMNISGSSGFRAYEVADFGWGKPRRTEPITMNHDGQVALMRSRDGQGVQVSVSLLQPAHMDAFKSSFLELLK